MNITYFHRYPDPNVHSMERLFNDVRGALPPNVAFKVCFDRFPSRGVLYRLCNAIEAVPRQGDVNHITGDVHYLACFLKKRKTLLTIHDCVLLEQLSGVRRAIIRLFWYWLPVKRSAMITVVSESTKRDLLRHLDCDSNKIRVVRNCVSPAYTYSPLAFNSHRPTILQVGTRQNKNLVRLAEALRGIPCHLLIVGPLSSSQVDVLTRQRIEFSNVSGVSDDDMVHLYRNSDLVAFASTYEGFGLPILEAQATGRPLVTSNILSMPEAAGDGACLIDPFDVESIRQGILRVIHDNEYREAIVQRGLANVEHFRPKAVAAQYMRLYEELLQ